MTIVKTQQELDAAVAAGDTDVIIRSPAGVWLKVRDSASVYAYDSASVYAYGSARVTAYGSASVTAYGSARVTASDSASVTASDSASVTASGSASVTAYGSARVTAYGSARVTAYDSARVSAYDSASVTAYGSASVTAGNYVAVHLHSQRVTLDGGVVIDMTAVNELDPVTWCDLHGVRVVDGVASLFKALDADLCAGHSYTKTKYAPGKKVTAKDWTDNHACGGGLHLGPTAHHSTAYRLDAERWVRVEVPVVDLRPILGGTAKVKCKTCRVVEEVDAWGDPLKVEAAS